MLRPRLIPSLLIHDNGLVKTIKFKKSKYIGDPINAVKIFSEKGADELVIFDIDATVQEKDPNYKLLKIIAKQARMPLCYGGGVKSIKQAEIIYNLGIEKIAVSSAAIENPQLIVDMVKQFGSQSVVVVLDLKKNQLNTYDIVTHNGSKYVKADSLKLAIRMQELGVGEIILNSVDQDGTMKGYDWELIETFRKGLNIPITILGGASSLENIEEAISKYQIIGIGVGSLFIFKGRHRAVLINYPNEKIKEKLYNKKY